MINAEKPKQYYFVSRREINNQAFTGAVERYKFISIADIRASKSKNMDKYIKARTEILKETKEKRLKHKRSRAGLISSLKRYHRIGTEHILSDGTFDIKALRQTDYFNKNQKLLDVLSTYRPSERSKYRLNAAKNTKKMEPQTKEQKETIRTQAITKPTLIVDNTLLTAQPENHQENAVSVESTTANLPDTAVTRSRGWLNRRSVRWSLTGSASLLSALLLFPDALNKIPKDLFSASLHRPGFELTSRPVEADLTSKVTETARVNVVEKVEVVQNNDTETNRTSVIRPRVHADIPRIEYDPEKGGPFLVNNNPAENQDFIAQIRAALYVVNIPPAQTTETSAQPEFPPKPVNAGLVLPEVRRSVAYEQRVIPKPETQIEDAQHTKWETISANDLQAQLAREIKDITYLDNGTKKPNEGELRLFDTKTGPESITFEFKPRKTDKAWGKGGAYQDLGEWGDKGKMRWAFRIVDPAKKPGAPDKWIVLKTPGRSLTLDKQSDEPLEVDLGEGASIYMPNRQIAGLFMDKNYSQKDFKEASEKGHRDVLTKPLSVGILDPDNGRFCIVATIGGKGEMAEKILIRKNSEEGTSIAKRTTQTGSIRYISI